MTAALLRLEHVTLGHPGGPSLFPPIDLEVPVGAFVGVVGPNGAGKTTLIKTLCGVLPPKAGRVLFPGGRPRVGYVPQQSGLDALFPLTALEVVTHGLLPELPFWQRLGAEHRQRAAEALAQLQVADLGSKAFRDLSGGQRQRVLIARALVGDPQLLALDEPTAAMDAVAAERLNAGLQSTWAQGRTVFLISHDLGRAASLADHLILLSRERSFVRAGPTAEIMTDAVLSEVFGAEVHVETHRCGLASWRYSVDIHLHEGPARG